MGRIKAIITDFDGTLVDTFNANYYAYHGAFKCYGYDISKELYKNCYGLRYDDLCNKLNIKEEDRKPIKELKKKLYPSFFNELKLNKSLLDFIMYLKKQGVKSCIASTASRENLYNVLNHFNIANCFDIIITGENAMHGKPNPEVYNKALTLLDCESDEALVFEDSNIGCEAAENAEINFIKVLKI